MALHSHSTIVTPGFDTPRGHGRTRNTPAWLASYVLGLASAGRPPAACVDEIVHAADRDVDHLARARRRLARLAVVDEDLRARADAMLAVATAGLGVVVRDGLRA